METLDFALGRIVNQEYPFFPGSYHEGEIAFAIGLEYSDLLMKAFSGNNIQATKQNLKFNIVRRID